MLSIQQVRTQSLIRPVISAAKTASRFHLTVKTSTDETTRTLAVVIQQQLREVGIALDVRTFEFATFYADITKGAFQMYTLRWIGGNEEPDIFRYAYATASEPPHGANRGYYSNPRSMRSSRRRP